MKIENIISGKLVIAIALINVILIALSYMGITEAAGFLYSTAGPYKYITGTESEYIKLNTNLVFSIVYILFYILSYLLILLYFGKTATTRIIAFALKVQILIYSIIFIIYGAIQSLSENKIRVLTEYNPTSFNIYCLIIAAIAVYLSNINNLKNVRMMGLTAIACLSVTILINFQGNILSASITNIITEHSMAFNKEGTPLYKHKATLLSGESLPDGVVTIERATENYTDYVKLFHYLTYNEFSNEDIFEIMEKFHDNFIPKDEAYLKSKIGYKIKATKIHQYNNLMKYKDEDIRLINIYKKDGVKAAMQALNETKNKTLLSALIKIKKNKENINLGEKNENNR